MKVFKMLKVSESFLILWTFVLTVHSFAILDIGTKVEVIKGEAVELSCVADQVICNLLCRKVFIFDKFIENSFKLDCEKNYYYYDIYFLL